MLEEEILAFQQDVMRWFSCNTHRKNDSILPLFVFIVKSVDLGITNAHAKVLTIFVRKRAPAWQPSEVHHDSINEVNCNCWFLGWTEIFWHLDHQYFLQHRPIFVYCKVRHTKFQSHSCKDPLQKFHCWTMTFELLQQPRNVILSLMHILPFSLQPNTNNILWGINSSQIHLLILFDNNL